jgi:hypothetical protein
VGNAALLPLIKEGEFARGLRSSREAAMLLHKKICADGRFLSPFAPELDILVWAVRAGSVAASSRLAQQIFAAAAREDLHLALAQLPSRFFLRLVARPAPAKQRYLPAFRAHEAGTSGLAGCNLEQTEPGDG